jgi:hypothetical protein
MKRYVLPAIKIQIVFIQEDIPEKGKSRWVLYQTYDNEFSVHLKQTSGFQFPDLNQVPCEPADGSSGMINGNTTETINTTVLAYEKYPLLSGTCI